MSPAQRNHLRRLLGWIRCEVGQTPEEMRETLRSIRHALTEYPDEAAQGRMMESYDRAASIPKYVRAAIKALHPLVAEGGELVADVCTTRANGGPIQIEVQALRIEPPSQVEEARKIATDVLST